MILIFFLECGVWSAWIKKGSDSVECLDRTVTSVMVWEMRSNSEC